jgi:aerotaxis receptor
MAPNGRFRTVGIDDLFFSTTDRKGVITGANSVFERLSAFPRQELMGAPHNVIRHPGMPGGAFRIMWDKLLAGQPFAAYVRNLAKDGFAYWVFATITPLGQNFLSVRAAPCALEIWQSASALYDQTIPLEEEARRSGMSRADAALLGRDALSGMLAQAGFGSYEEFMFTALPAEATARVADSSERRLPSSAHGEVAEIMAAALELGAQLTLVLGRLDALQLLATGLLNGSDQLSGTLKDLSRVTELASVASGRVEERAPVLASTARAMNTIGAGVQSVISPLVEKLSTVRNTVMELRFRIALAHLHDDMVIRFALEVLDGLAPPKGLTYVPLLCQSLSDDVQQLSQDMAETGAILRRVALEIDSCTAQFGQFQKLLSTWRLQVPRYGLSNTLGPLVGPIDAQLNASHDQLANLRRLAGQCSAEAKPFDNEALFGPISRISHIAGSLVGPEPPLPAAPALPPQLPLTAAVPPPRAGATPIAALPPLPVIPAPPSYQPGTVPTASGGSPTVSVTATPAADLDHLPPVPWLATSQDRPPRHSGFESRQSR